MSEGHPIAPLETDPANLPDWADPRTALVHAGTNPAANEGALGTPLVRSSIFAFPDADSAEAIHEGRRAGYSYARVGSPTAATLEAAVAALEGAQAGLALASGMAAVATTLLAVLKPGDHMVAPRVLYASTAEFLDRLLPRFGVEVSTVDATDPANYAREVRASTRLLYLESPANPTLALTDIAAVASIAREHRLLTVLDNTFATPLNQRPLDLGVDAAIHSATKYLGGHADLMGGIVVGPTWLIDEARWRVAKLLGGVISADSAWLTLRGLRTLAVRMERHNVNAEEVARYLSAHRKVVAVHYPWLESHPQYELARRQMRAGGGVLSFELAGAAAAKRLLNSVRLCSLAVSFGDVATLIQHSSSMTHASMSAERRLASGIGDGLLRLSVGIESVRDIVADLEQALEAV
jgi:methionine-gamma-lyase